MRIKPNVKSFTKSGINYVDDSITENVDKVNYKKFFNFFFKYSTIKFNLKNLLLCNSLHWVFI